MGWPVGTAPNKTDEAAHICMQPAFPGQPGRGSKQEEEKLQGVEQTKHINLGGNENLSTLLSIHIK